MSPKVIVYQDMKSFDKNAFKLELRRQQQFQRAISILKTYSLIVGQTRFKRLLFLTACWHLGRGEDGKPDLGNYWMYDHELFTRGQVP